MLNVRMGDGMEWYMRMDVCKEYLSLTRNPKVNTTPFVFRGETASADEMFGVLTTKGASRNLLRFPINTVVFVWKVKRHGVGNPPSVCR